MPDRIRHDEVRTTNAVIPTNIGVHHFLLNKTGNPTRPLVSYAQHSDLQPSLLTIGRNTLIKRYEFWPARLFETPYYLWLCLHCLLRGIGIRTLAKANYALNHGEIGLGSKYETHQAFDEKYFLPTDFLSDSLSPSDKAAAIKAFADTTNVGF